MFVARTEGQITAGRNMLRRIYKRFPNQRSSGKDINEAKHGVRVSAYFTEVHGYPLNRVHIY